MENPTIEVRDKEDGEKVYMRLGLYEHIMHLIYQGCGDGTVLAGSHDIEIFLNGEKIDKPIEMEDDG